jgi:hypothetical protein
MQDTVSFALFVLLSSYLFAKVEINVEGPDGWAAKLPTWKVENRWTRLVLGGKPLTGYHVYVFSTVALLCHLPFFLSMAPVTWANEARILSFITLFWILEDFLWFVLNPAFGLKRFNKDEIWWHRESWWLVAPRDYFLFTPVGLLLYWASRLP